MSRHLFIGSILSDIMDKQKVFIQETPQSSKDYISVYDVVRIIHDVALHGRERLYNVASGRNTTHGELAQCIKDMGIDVDFASPAPLKKFPSIDIGKIRSEFGFVQSSIVHDFSNLLSEHRKRVMS
jgi:nucleoside-diphosphate-sugar epimerase